MIIVGLMTLEEEKIVIDSCKDDITAFYKIYDNYVKDVYRFVYSYTKDKHVTEDIVSETFEVALKKIKSFEVRGTSIKSWLFAIARGILSNQWRLKKNQDSSLEEFMEVDDKYDIAQKVYDADMTERIFRYIEQFSEQIQQVFRLRLVDEMSFMEIAEVLGESESSTKMKYYRVVKKIRENFKLES